MNNHQFLREKSEFKRKEGETILFLIEEKKKKRSAKNLDVLRTRKQGEKKKRGRRFVLLYFGVRGRKE